MKYILTNDERKNAKGKKGKELEQVFLSYWQKRDPTPKTSINELMELESMYIYNNSKYKP